MSSAVRSSRHRLWAAAALAAIGLSQVAGLGAAQAVVPSPPAAAAVSTTSSTAAADPRMAGRIDATVTTERGPSTAARPSTSSTQGEEPMRTAATSPATLFQPMAPQRVLDTRNGTGAPRRQVAQGGSIVLDVAGALGVAPGAIEAVALNLTTTRATSPGGYVSVCPATMAVATCASSSSVSTNRGSNIAALVVSKVDASGRVRLYNYRGSLDLIADVNGYFVDSAAGQGDSYSTEHGAVRAFDSRTDLDRRPLGPQEYVYINFFDPLPEYPGARVTSIVVNLTVTQASELTYYSACPLSRAQADWDSCTGTSVVNADAGRTTPNLAIVQLDENGEALFHNSRGTSHLIVDVQGVFWNDPWGAHYHPLDPTRALDTRNGTGGVPVGKVGPGETLQFVPSPSVVPAEAEAVMATVTATGVTAPSTYFSVCPAWMNTTDCARISNLNPKNDRVVSNMAASSLSSVTDGAATRENELMIYNRFGEASMVMDLQGYFLRHPEAN